ncbi:polysaccharide deacetylase family protein [Ideonella sp. A 288]|uniref:polysaccharide deacetylase family protein n=1 Tax=Ideonella sp. A 288 TaxID=1962181 RepID=UPI000B4AF928|nr:polysaccharide deacetylase family protein [Ideonella sp. A 288]
MRRASSRPFAGAVAIAVAASAGAAWAAAPCNKPVFLTFDTGHMAVAPLVAEVLTRQQVKATFFLANERTREGGWSLDDRWADWWRARATEGHAFGSHTWDHGTWQADRPDGGFDLRPSMGPQAGRRVAVSAAGYCAELRRPADRFQAITGQAMLPLFRAPGGKTSPALLAAAKACGWTHVGWSPAGFLGDELPSDRYPNEVLLKKALDGIRGGDILLAHLGIWSRREPWAPAVLEPLIEGLKSRGFCFATLRDHPDLGAPTR